MALSSFVFNNEHIRDAAVNELWSSKIIMDGAKLWILRMQRKFLFSLRKIMLAWDWSPFEFYVVTNDYSSSINDFKIVYATANGQVFNIQ